MKTLSKEVTLVSVAESVDNLAIAVSKGFKEVDARLDGIDSRLDGIDTSLDEIRGAMVTKDDINKSIFADHGRRLLRIERKLQIA